ncbi:MAG: hypothetical protein J2P42_03935 [Candidatus Dormibacteraeota bacterium]|nr:hypothetical protein [Candidatus Dormibacteraeota bacterium]MBO0705158.1 hypothetical protein [Candidatus Dormibacteraeota bacterium]
MIDPATAYRTRHPIPFGEAMSGVLATVQLLPPDRRQDEAEAVEPPPREEAR